MQSKEKKNKNSCWIFLSHSSIDIEKIRMIRNEFEACGHNPLAFHLKCLNDSTPEGKQELWDLIFREIDTRDWFVFCASKAALTSKNVAKERAHIIEVGKKFVWEIDLSQPDEVIKDKIHKICSQIRIFVSATVLDLETFGNKIIQLLLKSDYDVLDFNSIKLDSGFPDSQIAISIKARICLLLITKQYLESSLCLAELNFLLSSGANCIALLFDDVELPQRINGLQIYRIPHVPKDDDALMIKELVDTILQIEIKGPIKFDAHVYDKLTEINERLNYTHRYHSMDPINIKTLGPTDDYAEVWEFPCCGTIVRTGDRIPSRERSDGCKCNRLVDH